MNDGIRMQISAFVDGELPQNEAELLLRRMCQDRELRQQASEYLAMGRIMRGERSVVGMGNLRDRIAVSLDESALQDVPEAAEQGGRRFMKPIAGLAIAATVALVAIVGLQQTIGVNGVEPTAPDTTVAGSTEGGAYTVPAQDNGQLREYYLRHNASSSYVGANAINARLVTLQLAEDVIVESETDNGAGETDETDSAEGVDEPTP